MTQLCNHNIPHKVRRPPLAVLKLHYINIKWLHLTIMVLDLHFTYTTGKYINVTIHVNTMINIHHTCMDYSK